MNPKAATILALAVSLLLAPVAGAQESNPNAEPPTPQADPGAPQEPQWPLTDAQAPATGNDSVAFAEEGAEEPWVPMAPEKPSFLARMLVHGPWLLIIVAAAVWWIGKKKGWWAAIGDRIHDLVEPARAAAALEEDDRTPTAAWDDAKRVRRGPDAGAPLPGLSDIRRGEDHHELLTRINEDPAFLADSIQAFCDQDDGAEQLRQFCEDHTFEAKTPESTEEIYLIPLTEDQLRNIPADVLRSAMSRRSQPRAGAIPITVVPKDQGATTVPVTEKKRAKGGTPPRAPLAPPVDEEPKGGDAH